MTEREGAPSDKDIWTPANMVTLARICLVPVFVIIILSPWPEWLGIHDVITTQVKAYIAAGVFVVISCTDWIDGYLARSRGEVTDFGKFLDPLADKILVAAALIALVELDVIPSWPVLIILIREFIVSGIRMIAAANGVVIAASWYGKAKTVLQIAAIVLFIVKDRTYTDSIVSVLTDPLYIASWAVMLAALVLTVLSLLDYISKSRYLLGACRRSGPKSMEGLSGHGALAEGDGHGKDDPDGSDGLDDLIYELACKVISGAIHGSLKLCTAESLTGGMISSALTSVPGSSACFLGGVASYDLSVKHKVLHVDGRLLETEGAVNEQCALQMAAGAVRELEANLAVAVTGIAGPGGEEPGKPVGTVFIAVCLHGACHATRMQYEGTRQEIRKQTAADALKALLDAIDSARLAKR